MNVPRDAFVRDFRMAAEERKRTSERFRIGLFSLKQRLLFLSLIPHAHSSVEDREIVVRRNVVWVDCFERLKLLQRIFVIVPLKIGDAELASRVARLWKLLYEILEISQFRIGLTSSALQLRPVIEGAGIVRAQRQRLFNGFAR